MDIGAGDDTRKVERLLNAFQKTNKIATYLALYISKASQHNISYLARRHSSADAKVTCAGIWETFEDGQMFVNRINGPKLCLSLGAVLCNDQWVSAVEHLKSWKAVMRSGDMMLVGMDAHLAYNQRDKLWKAYYTRKVLYRQFFLNGFDHANRLVAHRWFLEEDWEFCAEIEEEPTARHRFYFVAKRCIEYEGMERAIAQGEEYDWFDSHKDDEQNVQIVGSKARLRVIDIWRGAWLRIS